MQKYQSIISGTNGSVIRNVPVTVLKEDGSLAEIFMDREGQVQAPNPLVTDSRGVFYFYAKNGRYSLRTAADGVQITDADTVLLFDPDETASDGPIADAVRRAEDAAERAETALVDSGLQNLVQDAQNASANAVQAVIDANQAAASIDAALIEAGEAKDAAQAAAQTASNAAIGAQAVKDSLLTYSGTLSAAPEWSDVPAHEDFGLDAQTQAALNRIEKLKDDQQLLKQRADKSVLSFPDYAAASAAAATLPDGQVLAVDETKSVYTVQSGLLVYKSPTAEGRMDGAGRVGPTDPVDWYYGGPEIRRPAFSTQDMSIFVDPALGNDANTGSQSQPIKTLKEAVQRLPERIFHKIRVYLLDGTYPADDCFRLFNYYVTARGRAGLRFVGHIASLDGEAHPVYTDTNPDAVIVQGFEHMNSGIRGTEEVYFAGITFKDGWYENYDCYSLFVNCKFTGGHRSTGWNTYHAIGGHFCQMDFINCDFSNLAQIGTLTNFANATFENCTLNGLTMTSDAPNPGRPFLVSNRSTVYIRNSPTLLQTGPGGKSITTTGGEIFDFKYSPLGYNAIRRNTPDRNESLYLLGHDGGALGTGRGAGVELNGVNHPTAPGRATIEFAGGGTTPKFSVLYDAGGSPSEVLKVSRYGEVTAKSTLVFSSQQRALSGYLSDGQATLYTNPTSGDVFVVSKLGGVMKYVRLLEFATAPTIT